MKLFVGYPNCTPVATGRPLPQPPAFRSEHVKGRFAQSSLSPSASPEKCVLLKITNLVQWFLLYCRTTNRRQMHYCQTTNRAWCAGGKARGFLSTRLAARFNPSAFPLSQSKTGISKKKKTEHLRLKLSLQARNKLTRTLQMMWW